MIAIISGLIYSSLWFVWLNIANPEENEWDFPNLFFSVASAALSIGSLYMAYRFCLSFFHRTRLRRFYAIMLLLSLPIFSIIYLLFWVVFIRQMIYGLRTDIEVYPKQLVYIITSLHLVMSIIVISSLYNDEVQKVELQLTKMQAIAAETQLKVLQQQVDPHFLFNSLNILTALMRIKVDKSIVFTEKLSEVYRFFLKTKKELLISLEEELTFVEDYFYLVNCRFGEAFKLTIQNDNNIPFDKLYIIPGTLQLLIENVIKHNSADEVNPLTIQISVEKGRLIVSNEISRKENNSSGFGLKNLKKRYELLNKQSVLSIEKEGVFFVYVLLIKNLI